MNMSEVSVVKQTLSGSTVHEIWEQTYRNAGSERLYERVFDWIAAREPLEGKRALDIGCGIGQHAIRLANRGCDVVAADFSNDRVCAAQRNIERQGFGSRISVRNEDLEAGLSFSDGSYDIVLCWGVLMHVPKIEDALCELIRVTRPAGKILVYEANLFGFDAILTAISTAIKKLSRRLENRKVQFSKFGREYWNDTPSGRLLTRHSKISVFVDFFESQGCPLRHRLAGEFTEIYGLGGPIAPLAHLWDRIWFAAGHVPYLAHGNLLVFERNSAPTRRS
jgi:2-polyprenyl-3-methyl-5-hydroxy-6-metoxy-1,4-benzoquinol methylase